MTGRPTASARPLQTVPPAESQPVTGEVPEAILDAMRADAAERGGVAVDEVAVNTAETVEWSDGSMGCPEPGMVYTQAIVPGYLVVLEAGGSTYEYHAAEAGSWVYCENPQPPVS